MEIINNVLNTINNIKILQTIIRIVIIIIISRICIKVLTSKTSWVKKAQKRINLAKGKENINNESIQLFTKIIKVLINIVAVFLIIQELGFDLKGLIAGLGLGGVIITLAAQDTAKNLFGGFVIFLDKPFKVGDFIEAGVHTGNVEDITFRSTALRTLNGSLVHIPNSEMSSIPITNWNETNKRRYITNIGLTLETPLEKIEIVKNEIIEMLKLDEEILTDSIMVTFENITANSIEIIVIAYTETVAYSAYLKIKERLNYQIMKIIENNKVDLAYETQTIHIKN